MKPLELIRTARYFRRNFASQKQCTARLTHAYLGEWQVQNDGSLQKKDWRRMRDYPWQFNVFFADIFARMRGQVLSVAERERITLYAAALCLYDDFLDNAEVDIAHIRAIYLAPQQYLPQSDKQRAFVRLMMEMYARQPLDTQFEHYFGKFCEGQINSKAQLQQTELPREVLRRISFDKGGYALVLARLLMDNRATAQELEAVYTLGAWYQILDDTLDIAKDRRERIQTLATTIRDVRVLEADLAAQTKLMYEALRALPYPSAQIESAIFTFHLIATSGWVHLARLRRLQARTQGIFALQEYAEQELLWVEQRRRNVIDGVRLLWRSY